MLRGLTSLYGKRFAFWSVFILVTVILLSGSLWVINFVQGKVALAADEPVSTIYIDYNPDGSYISAESITAVGQYIQQFPEPQNVKVLTGMTTTEVWNFMTIYMAGGLQVDCTYCHNINNFGADGPEIGDDEVAARKDNARLHLEMVADLNKNWITQLSEVEGKQPSGAQIICATCHNGQPQPVAWADELHALPNDYRLPLRDANGNVGTPADIDAALLVTGRDDIYSLDAVQYNQHTMYHMSESLGVGCTHCHNSRYFPSWEQPAKYYALTMLQMNQHILGNYADSMNNQEPSCVLCHQNQVRPPGAVREASALPDTLATGGYETTP